MNKRPLIQKAARFVLVGFGLLFMLTQYNNCGGYDAANTTLDSSAAVLCTNTACTASNADNLNVTVHLGNGDYGVTAGLSEFNLGGDCNEAGFLPPPGANPATPQLYPSNYIHWDLVDPSGAVVRTSAMTIGFDANNQPINSESKCVNGRFLIYVPLAALTINNADPYDRTGLLLPTHVRSAYNLHITIFGVDPSTGTQGQYQTNVPLSAI